MTRKQKSLIAMIIVSVLVILATTAVGLSFWRSHMAMSVDTTKQFMLGKTEITDQINYQTVTNTYLTGFVMIILGSLAGIYFDAALWGVYGIVMLLIYAVKKMRAAEYKAQTENKNNSNTKKASTR